MITDYQISIELLIALIPAYFAWKLGTELSK